MSRKPNPECESCRGLGWYLLRTKIGWDDQTCECSYSDAHARAVAIFEARMGFGYTDAYEQSREWSDAMAEATRPIKPEPTDA